MHYLITGHTGFKGSWLTLMLQQAGHTVSGVALDPVPGSLFERLDNGSSLENDVRLDIRDATSVRSTVERVQPDVIIHLAAQALVRESYRDPRGTLETNVWGTINVLDAVRASPSVAACLVVTTDKVYRNDGRLQGYRESDPLGGTDPYSASKAMADLATQSWRASYPGAPIAIARAGNVVGGGDVAPDRLMPDLLAAFNEGTPARIRNPEAVRPWQHVLDCLSGYLLLVDSMLSRGTEGEWNFGPDPAGFRTVADVADLAVKEWGSGAAWTTDEGDHPYEAATLTLDASKARQQLGWQDRLDVDASIAWTAEWQRSVNAGESALTVSRRQIDRYQSL